MSSCVWTIGKAGAHQTLPSKKDFCSFLVCSFCNDEAKAFFFFFFLSFSEMRTVAFLLPDWYEGPPRLL